MLSPAVMNDIVRAYSGRIKSGDYRDILRPLEAEPASGNSPNGKSNTPWAG